MRAPLPPMSLTAAAPGAAPPPPSPTLRAAPLLRRMAAFTYEGVLLFGVLFAAGLVYAVTVHQTHALEHRAGLIATCFLVLALYFIGLWCRGGQTLAMKTWDLRVLRADGAPLSPWRALARHLCAWVWFLPPLVVAHALAPRSLAAALGLPVAWIVVYALSSRLHPRRQFWHDALCGTAIVDAPRRTRLAP